LPKAINKAQRNAILNILPIQKYVVTTVSSDVEKRKEEKESEKVETFEVPSEKDSTTVYIVKHHSDGRWECSCPSFLFRGEECTHIKKTKGTKNEDKRN